LPPKPEVFFDGLQQGSSDFVSNARGRLSSCFLSIRLSLNKDGFHAQPAAGLDIGKRIADHYAILRIDFGEIFRGLLKKPNAGLTAIAFAVVMGAVVDGIQASALTLQEAPHLAVNELQLINGKPAQCNTALIADHDDSQTGAIHASNRLDGSRKPLKLRPVAHISALGQLAVQHSIAVEKNVTHYNYQG
jgi:hypothetical protein